MMTKLTTSTIVVLLGIISQNFPTTVAEYEVLVQIQQAQDQILDGVKKMNLEFSVPHMGQSYRRIARDVSTNKKMELFEALIEERFSQLKADFDRYEKLMDCSQAMDVPNDYKQEFYAVLDSQADANRKSMAYLKSLPGVDDGFRTSVDELIQRHDQYIKHVEKCVPRE
ncbi:hypothetical protein QAD02_018275 [Eretmocerus hayati]|uniref:Uncharacterized protein n=1 Tax=Eretmocerus hayati TaxID=131215 RepID=A0ACC2PHH4_9HYME|nr:hypothetical protein QAD02_018275 [Eretmocerus hayati]